MPVELTIVESVTELETTVTEVILESASTPGPAGPGVPAGGTANQVLTKDSGTDYDTSWQDAQGGGGGAPTDVDYLVGTASGDLSAEIVVGTSPGGELGGSWASPTVDTVHSGSSHAATQAAAEATAAAALAAHEADTTSIHGITDTSALETTSGAQAKVDAHVNDTVDAHDATAISVDSTNLAGTGTDVQTVLEELEDAVDTKQASDSDLTAIAGLSPTNDDIIQRKAGAWTNRTMAQLIADLAALGTTFQPLDSDLTAIAALSTTAYGRALLALADPADATKFLDGTGAYDTVKDSDLSTSDITTNNVSTSKHGFAPKLPNDATKYLDGTGAYTVPAGSGGSTDGWVDAGETWTYAAADSPTFTFTIAGVDLTSKYSAGMRIKLTQTTAKYFIITKVAFSTDTTITVYGGTDYTLANASITSPKYSTAKAPAGFPLDPTKWTITLISDTSDRGQSTPSGGTWYNLGSLSGAVHIGAWDVQYWVVLDGDRSNVTQAKVTLSTANNSESDGEFTTEARIQTSSARVINTMHRRKKLVLTAKTTYYLNAQMQDLSTAVDFRGDRIKTLVTAECAYL